MSLGTLPGGARRTQRMPANPLDKSTIVSIYPRQINENILGVFPGRFEIPAGSKENPGLLVVGTSSWWKDIGEEQPLLEIPVHSVAIAESIVKDYTKGLLGANPDDAGPGIFYIPGEHKLADIKSNYAHLLDLAEKRQRKWFGNLVKIADTLWSRSNNNPLAISNDARLAAEYLNLKDKPWLQDFRTIEQVPCKACGFMVNPAFPVCGNCKAIVNPEKAKELGLKFAQA